MFKIYIASPYTTGDVTANVRRSMEMSNRLMDEGFAPYCPLVYHLQELSFPRPYEDWMQLDLEWIKSCDGLLRLDGESPGAEREVKFARELDIPVFYNLAELKAYFARDPWTIDL